MLTKRAWKSKLSATVLATLLGLTACGGGSTTGESTTGASGTAAATTSTSGSAAAEETSTEAKTDGPVLAVYAGSQTPIVANFNPYSPTALPGTLGSIYEPLFYYNKAEVGDPVPLLAESFEWAEDGLSLVIKLREGVKWTDGKDFTADDVVYSFTNKAVSMAYLDAAEKTDDTTVTLKFKEPQYTNEYAMLGATYIVPKHVFEAQSDLVTFTNADKPVGTGPFTPSATTDAAYSMVKNEGYWDPERPKINEIQYIGIEGNSSAEALFKAGQLDYSTMFIPQPEGLTADGRLAYLRLNSPNPITILTCSNTELGCKGAQTDKAVRQAFSKSLNRTEINEKAYYGHSTLAAPTFTLPERDDAWIKDGLPKLVDGAADVEGAKKILEDAGYTLGSDGIYAKDGVRASFTLNSVEGWGDANAAGELMVSQAKAAGIEVKAETVTLDQYTEMRGVGQYEMIISALFGTPISDPYTIYRNSFTTEYTTPVGTALGAGQTNFARYSNPDVDAAVKKAASTNDEAVKKEAYGVVQTAIVEDVPYIPMFHGGSQTFTNQVDFDGWPTEDNKYAFPASWDGLSAAYVMSNITYK